MSGKTKIVVLHTKEIIYTTLFAVLGILLVVLLLCIFMTKSGKDEPATAYVPGVYHACLALGDQSLDIQVIVDANEILSIDMKNTSESVTAMYPLMEPSLEQLSSQIYEKQSLEDITYSEENRYTSMLLLNTIECALEKASSSQTPTPTPTAAGSAPTIIY